MPLLIKVSFMLDRARPLPPTEPERSPDFQSTMGGLSHNWDMLPQSIRDVRPDDFAQMALSQVHEGHRLQAAFFLQDMYRSQSVLSLQDRALQQMEHLIRRIRTISEARDSDRDSDRDGDLGGSIGPPKITRKN
jgi:hypothetical protein